MIGTQARDQLTHHHSRHARIGNRRLCKKLSNIGVHVIDTVLTGDIRQITDPVDATSFFKLAPGTFGAATAAIAIATVIDDEIQLWPIFCGLRNVINFGELQEVWKTLFDRGWKQTFVNAHVFKPRFGKLFVRGVHQLFVI